MFKYFMSCSRKYLTAAIMVSIILAASGCLEDGEPSLVNTTHSATLQERIPHYSWGYANRSSIDINGVRAFYFQDNQLIDEGMGVLRNGSDASRAWGLDPIPPKVTLEWKTPDGQVHQKPMLVASAIPDEKDFNGTIWFKYSGGDDWTMVLTAADDFVSGYGYHASH